MKTKVKIMRIEEKLGSMLAEPANLLAFLLPKKTVDNARKTMYNR